jgi:hypothetical protein
MKQVHVSIEPSKLIKTLELDLKSIREIFNYKIR